MAAILEQTERIERAGIGILEQVNGNAIAESREKRIFLANASDSLRLIGWCFRDEKQLETPSKDVVLIVIDYTSLKEYHLVGSRFSRNDVAARFNNRVLDVSGFACETLPGVLPTGLYNVEIMQGERVRTVLGNGLIALL